MLGFELDTTNVHVLAEKNKEDVKHALDALVAPQGQKRRILEDYDY